MRFVLTVLLLAGTARGSSIDRAVIKPVLQKASPAFKRCYERALQRETPALEGRARLTLTVVPSGTVSEVSVEFPGAAQGLTRCLKDAAQKLRFYRGSATIKLVWPIDFLLTSLP